MAAQGPSQSVAIDHGPETIELIVGLGASSKTFAIQANVLLTKAPKFMAGHQFDHKRSRAGNKVIRLPDVSSEVFPAVLDWLYTGAIDGAFEAGVSKAKSLPITSDRMEELLRFLIDLSRKPHGENFRFPFPQLWPNSAEAYARIIANPIDLGTIIRKLKDRKYTTFDALKADGNLIYANVCQFHGPNHDLAKSAREVYNDIDKKLSDMNREAFSQTVDVKPGNTFVAVKSGPKLSTFFVHGFMHKLFAIISLAEQLGVNALAKDGVEVLSVIQKNCDIDLELYAPSVWLQTKERSFLRWWFERMLSSMTFMMLAKGPEKLESRWLGDVPGMLDSAAADAGEGSSGGNQRGRNVDGGQNGR